MATRKRTSRKNKGDKTVRIIVQIVVALSFIALGYFIFHKLYPQYRSFEETKLANKFQVRGIDLSHHNEDINWNTIREEGITFAYLKVTEGSSFFDNKYKQNYREARMNNIYVGSYHFFNFDISGEEQANHFIKKADCQKGDLVPTIDVEHSSRNKYSSDKNEQTRIIEQLRILEKKLRLHYGKAPIIYTNKECFKLYINRNFPNNPIWICDLHKEPDSTKYNWEIWQFSHKGELQGVYGDVDLSFYRFSFEKFKDLVL